MQRIKTPEETIKLLEPYIYKSSITRVADLTLLDDTSNLHVFSAIRPTAKSISVSMGKSMDILSAKCGAITESFETYLAEEIRPELENVSVNNLAKNKKIIGHVNLENYRCKFGVNYPLNWNIGYELSTKYEVYIPSYLLSLDTNILTNQFFGSNSEGIASGNNLEEAQVASLFERIERISIRNDIRYILNFDKQILEKYKLNLDYIYKFFIFENDFKIPVVGVELYNKNFYANQCVYCGYGAAETYEHAIYRALEEAIQTKVGVISGARDDLIDDYYLIQNTVNFEYSLNEHDGLYPDIISYNAFDLLAKIISAISDLGYKIIVFEYFNNNFFVVRTFIVNSENNIL